MMSTKQVICLWLCAVIPVWADTKPATTLAHHRRPEWLRREGLVMAGSWEPLVFRVRRGPRGKTPPSLNSKDGGKDYQPTPEQLAAYRREHSPEMIGRLKTLGVNFVMMHCYKGAGMVAEHDDMVEAVRWAKLCHDAGLHVGTYLGSSTLLWELFFKEVPEAKGWVLRDKTGKPYTYGSATYRQRLDRNHPDAHAYYLKVIRFAVEQVGTDLIHFDNYLWGPCDEPNSARRFRDYLRNTFTPEQLAQMGAADLGAVQPATSGPPDNMLRRAWLDFVCRSLADSYRARCEYARSLRNDILIECNPHGVREAIRPPVDHFRMLRVGEAYWDEGRGSGLSGGRLRTRIRSYKVGRLMNNMVFTYNTNPLELAEAMAFNLDCLGCICFFEYAIIRNRPWVQEGVLPESKPFIRFFNERGDLLRPAGVVADVAVLRSFPSQVFSEAKNAALTNRVEQALIENRVPFQIIGEEHLRDLSGYRALVLAGCVALSDEQIEQIRRYVGSGGRLCIIGPAATYDEWMIPRDKPALNDLPASRVVRASEKDEILAAVRRALQNKLSASVNPVVKTKTDQKSSSSGHAIGLCIELTAQPNRRMLHLVNYRGDRPFTNVAARVRLPAGRRANAVRLVNPTREADLKIPFKEKDGQVAFSIPQVDVYEIAVVDLQ